MCFLQQILIIHLIFSCMLYLCCSKKGSQRNNLCLSKECKRVAREILESMDPSINPCEDFYAFSCGNYIKKTVIPDDMVSVNLLSTLQDKLYEKIRSVVFKEISPSDPLSYRLVKHFMKLCMDEAKMDATGVGPASIRLLRAGHWPVLGALNQRHWSLTNTIATLYNVAGSADSLFSVVVTVDYKNSNKRIVEIDDPKLGLAREILVAGPEDSRVKAYYQFMVDVAVIFGAKEKTAREDLKRSLLLEIELAKLIKPKEERRDLEKVYNPFTLRQLASQISWIDWRELFRKIIPRCVQSLREDDIIIVIDPEYLRGVGELLRRYPRRTISNYIMWQAARGFTPYLTTELRDRTHKLNKEIYGVTSRKPRWKECVEQADISYQHAMGSIYVKHFFDSKSKKVAVRLMKMIQKEMEKVLAENDWMDKKTREGALRKVVKMNSLIGYPNELLDMKKLDGLYTKMKYFQSDNFLSTVINADLGINDVLWKLLREPVNKTDWMFNSNVNQVNAFFYQFENSVKIPAGILQHPYFDKHLPLYINLGRIGHVMGHEITHGFDDQGSQTDEVGNLRNWWDEESRRRFKERTNCIANQFSSFKDNLTQMNINGIATQGETVADQGSVKLIYRALKQLKREEPMLPGLQNYTQSQLLLISVGTAWCTKPRKEAQRYTILSGSHPPGEFRVKGIMMNFPHFKEIFNCKRGDPMVPEQTCVVW